MTIDNDKFLRDLRDDFAGESQDQLRFILSGLVSLENTPDSQQRLGLVQGIYRELHNMKGSARAVEFPNIEAICQTLENIFSALVHGELSVSQELADLLHEAVKLVGALVACEERQADPEEIQQLIRRLNEAVPEGAQFSDNDYEQIDNVMVFQASAASVAVAAQSIGGTPSGSKSGSVSLMDRSESLRVSTAKLDSIMQKTEEMLSTKSMARQQSVEVRKLQGQLQEWSKTSAKTAADTRAARRFLEKLIGSAESVHAQSAWRKVSDLLDWHSTVFDTFNERVGHLSKVTNNFSHTTSLSVDVLVEDAKRLLMMPCSNLLQLFPVIVRDLSRELGKEVEFVSNGGQIELDKRILNEVRDPLIHILRNALDHGMELPDRREQQGKPRRGKVSLNIRQVSGTMVEITIADDGRGIDVQAVKNKAVTAGILTAEECAKLSDEEARMLIFRPAFSTSPTVTEISGRGLGLAIVEETIRKLGGKIALETAAGAGTTFRIALPMTIATFRGVLVAVGSHMFLVPTTDIDRVVRLKRQEIRSVQGVDTIVLGESVVPVRYMSEMLELPAEDHSPAPSDFLTVCVLGVGSQRQGFIVDQVMEEQEVLVKSLGASFGQTQNISGVTILGSGRVVPILNVGDMLVSGKKVRIVEQTAPLYADRQPSTGKVTTKRVMVVDDTITARNLLRTILESAGHHVSTANDGLEALDLLQQHQFDLVVTDIEMPNMNGFELTASIRSHDKLSRLPVVIVTSMTSRADRERGVAAGASAYFVKSSFDQNNLLDVVKGLL